MQAGNLDPGLTVVPRHGLLVPELMHMHAHRCGELDGVGLARGPAEQGVGAGGAERGELRLGQRLLHDVVRQHGRELGQERVQRRDLDICRSKESESAPQGILQGG